MKKSRSSRLEAFFKKGVLQNIAKSTRKALNYWTIKKIVNSCFLKSSFIWIQLSNNWDNLLKQFPHTRLVLLYYYHQKIWKQGKTAILPKLVFSTQKTKSLYTILIFLLPLISWIICIIEKHFWIIYAWIVHRWIVYRELAQGFF